MGDGVPFQAFELFLEQVHVLAQVAHVAPQFEEDLVQYLALRLEAVVAVAGYGCQLGALLVLRYEVCEHLGRYRPVLAQYGYLLGDVLELAHVAGPLVPHQHLLGLVGQRHFLHPVLLGHLHREQAEQQHDVFAAVAQRRHLYGYGVEAVIQVFAEAAFADGLAYVHVGGCHYPHVGLPHLGGPYGYVFARFEHAQQACLRGERQLAHLVEEQCSLVCHAEIARAVVYRAGERAFHVAEQLAVNRSLGYRPAVYREVLLAAAR